MHKDEIAANGGEMADDIVVLVSLGPRNRTVSFLSEPSTAYESLQEAIRREFGDVYWSRI